MPAARSACASCARPSTWWRARATFASDLARPAPAGARIGILGGTFNPPHLGHLICAQEAHLQLGLERVILMPAGRPPHKPSLRDEPGAAHRLELCRLAVGADPRLAVSDLEVRRAGPSYTVDTLSELRCLMPDSELFLVVGGDVAAGLGSWREPWRVLGFATLAVARRRGTTRRAVEGTLRRLDGGARAEFFRMPEIDISSSEVRRRVRERRPISYLVPGPVARYIDEHHLYARRTQGGSGQ